MEAWRVAPSRSWRGECTPPLSQPSPLKGRGLMERDNENSFHRTRKHGRRDGREPREGGARGARLRPQRGSTGARRRSRLHPRRVGRRSRHGRRGGGDDAPRGPRSEEHTSELQSLMRISYAVFCLKKKTKHKTPPSKHIIP